MSLECYRLVAQLGAGPDGVAYRAVAGDGKTEVSVYDLSAARADASRWSTLAPRLRMAAQLAHPAAIRVLELGLEEDPPYIIMEWVGTTALTALVRAAGLRGRHDAMELIHAAAGAVRAAHRLGLSHGRIWPAHVLMVGATRPKLDFTGAAVGFPCEADSVGFQFAADGRKLAVDMAADLHDLGALFSWLLADPGEQLDRRSSAADSDAASPLGRLVRDLLADDPAERPSAREVQERLDELLTPMDDTGNWEMPREAVSQSDLVLQSRREGPIVPSFGAGTLVLEKGAPRLGRYLLLDVLGEGGQGVVHRAEDSSNGSIVAIKILRTDRVDNPEVLRRFRKEARLMAEANNPYVVNLLEFNEDDGIPYMVLEFVAGDTLGRLLRDETRLGEKEALSFMAPVARGLMEAHERGIVHRDIKPSNILLLEPRRSASLALPETEAFNLNLDLDHKPSQDDFPSDSQAVLLSTTAAEPVDTEIAGPRVKITDFGLARHVVDTESLALTAAGALLGTPHYMAPEQWTGRAVDPRTDVYAMGATLFHLLAGRPPFVAETRDDICKQHCNNPPPSVRALVPGVSEGVERLVERALAKRPEDRYFDAGAMLRDIEALLHGKPSDLAIHPRLPDCDPSRIVQFEFRWELEGSPRDLWPLVTNTDRLDRAIGFLPVKKTTRFEPGRGVRTFAEGRKAGMVEVGEEHPYEWIELRRMGVLREYSQGPFLWMVSVVELVPRAGGGTTLFHRLRLEPRSWKIRLGSRWGVGVSLKKSLERVYRRIDATLKSQRARVRSPRVDPFEEPAEMPAPRRQRLERLLDRLVEEGTDVEVVDRLGEHLAFGPAQEVARIRPLAIAQSWGLDPEQVANACLRGAREGLLELHWDLLCPVCRISCDVKDTLRAIALHAHCDACHRDFQLDFANSIELIFRVHPEVRAADLGTYCIGGPAHSPHVLAQVRVAAGERIEIELELQAGSYRLRGPQLPWSVDFEVQNHATIRRWDIDLGSAPERPPALRTGGQALILENPHPGELVVRIERTATRTDALTAARATSMSLFRELFPNEVLAPGQLATVSMVTLMVTALDPQQADALYQDLGDVRAFSVVQEYIQRQSDAIREGGGAVVKTMGEGLLASFADVEAAVRTGLDLGPRLIQMEAAHQLRLRVGIHRGTSLAATVNDHLDYFGTTARQAVATLQHSRGGDLVLTQPVAADPAVAALLHARKIEGEVVPAALAGKSHVIRVKIEPASSQP
jgi:serine/threonine protein kinase/class 3 adenylate cyclase